MLFNHTYRKRDPASTPPDAMAALSHLMPEMKDFWDRSLGDYAHAVYDVRYLAKSSDDREVARARLRDLVVRVARRRGFGRDDAADAGAQLLSFPVLQTGPHCLLALEPDAFYTHLFCMMGLTSHARRWHISYQCSTVKFSEKAKKGPGWLKLDGDAVNLFGMSRRDMDRLSVCGSADGLRFLLSAGTRSDSDSPSTARLRTLLPQRGFPSAAEAIEAGNQILWKHFFPPTVQILQFSDVDVADLVADHLEQPKSWLARCFVEDPRFSLAVLSFVDRLNGSAWGGWIRRTTDFFWGMREGQLFVLRLKDGALRSERAEADIAVPFSALPLAEALRSRIILPNMLIVFLVLSILPGVRVLGGCRQTIYYPLMRAAFAAAMEKLGGNEPSLDLLRQDKRPGVWGHRVLRPNDGDPFADTMGAGGTVSPLIHRYMALALRQACGNLESFTADSSWAALSSELRAGLVDRQDAEWAWA